MSSTAFKVGDRGRARRLSAFSSLNKVHACARMKGTQRCHSYATEKHPLRPVWIIITLTEALLLHNKHAFNRTACRLTNGFASQNQSMFQLLLFEQSPQRLMSLTSSSSRTRTMVGFNSVWRAFIRNIHDYLSEWLWKLFRSWHDDTTLQSTLLYIYISLKVDSNQQHIREISQSSYCFCCFCVSTGLRATKSFSRLNRPTSAWAPILYLPSSSDVLGTKSGKTKSLFESWREQDIHIFHRKK